MGSKLYGTVERTLGEAVQTLLWMYITLRQIVSDHQGRLSPVLRSVVLL